jgi:hypothetical protein
MAKAAAVGIKLRDVESEGDYLEEYILLQGANELNFERVAILTHKGKAAIC